MDKIDLLNKMIKESNKIVFFGGAGVSTESGIPDFRSQNGLYNQKYEFPPEEILSHHFFINNTRDFYKFYFDKMIYENIKPNTTHYKLKELEDNHKLSMIITQNIDNLHEDVGSKKIIKLHGSVKDNYCLKCGKYYDINYIIKNGFICPCKGIIKPDVVLYEERLKDDDLNNAIKYISSSDMLIIAGTSLNVYPAASLIKYYNGNKLVIINKSPTSFDNCANLVINSNLGDVFSKINTNKYQ